MARSKVEGADKLKRLLRRLPDDASDEVRRAVKQFADELLQDMRGDAPHPRIREALSSKISADGLGARVGIQGARDRRKGFIAWFIEFGTKPHDIWARKALAAHEGRPVGSGRKAGKWAMATEEGQMLGRHVSHPGVASRPFFFRPWVHRRSEVMEYMKRAVRRALEIASAG